MKIHSRHLRTRLFILVVLVLLILGCVPATKNPVQSITTTVPSTTLSVVQDTFIPLATVTTVPTPTAQQTIELSLEKDCIPIEEKMPDDIVLSGVWLRSEGKPYLENLDEHTKYEVPLKGRSILDTYPSAGDTAISPDGKHLAYIDSYLDSSFRVEKRILRIINSAGHSLPMDYWKGDWQWIIGWVDNHNLMLSLGTQGSQGVIILNPFTGSWNFFERPDWLKDDYFRWSYSYIPMLDWFVDYSNSPHLLLKDLKTGNTIWQTENWGGFTWSKDGSTLAVVSSNSVELISKNAVVTEFAISKFETDPWDKLVLSTGGQRLFFSTGYPEKFFFLDFKKSKIEALCPGEYDLYGNYPFWSPDNRFLILGVYDTGYYSTYNPYDILVDTEQIRAYKLPTRPGHERLAWFAQS